MFGKFGLVLCVLSQKTKKKIIVTCMKDNPFFSLPQFSKRFVGATVVCILEQLLLFSIISLTTHSFFKSVFI